MDPIMPRKTQTFRVPKSLLEREAHEAKRALLRRTLIENGWGLADTARALEMVGPSGRPASATVLRAIRALGLSEEYEANKPS